MIRMTRDEYKRAAAALEALPDLVIDESYERGLSPGQVAKEAGVPTSVLMGFADQQLPPLPSAIKLLRWLGSVETVKTDSADRFFAGTPCAADDCGREECATVHMVPDDQGGHEYRAGAS